MGTQYEGRQGATSNSLMTISILSGLTLGTCAVLAYYASLKPHPLWNGPAYDEDDVENYTPPTVQRKGSYSPGGEAGGVLDGIPENVSNVMIESILWKDASSFCPPQVDKTGIARVDGAVVHARIPAEDTISTSFIPLPTHTWVLFGIFDGENGAGASTFLSNSLPLAILGGLAELLGKYNYDPTTGSAGSGGELVDDMSNFSMLQPNDGIDPNVIPFTPDLVRPSLPSSEIEEALTKAFTMVDDYLVKDGITNFLTKMNMTTVHPTGNVGPKEEVGALLRNAQPGSSAIVGFYESDSRVYKALLVGDSRAILGRPRANDAYSAPRDQVQSSPTRPKPKAKSNKWGPMSVLSAPSHDVRETALLPPRKQTEYETVYEVHRLSKEHVPSNDEERARIRKEHPKTWKKLFDEDKANGAASEATYLGIKTTRGFGYGALKWSKEVQERLHHEYMGDQPHWVCALDEGSLPYLTATPTITSVQIQPGDFVVLGSKGLWECLTNEEVVGLVGVWAEERRRGGGGGVRDHGEAQGRNGSLGDRGGVGGAFGGAGGTGKSLRDPKSFIPGIPSENYSPGDLADALQGVYKAHPSSSGSNEVATVMESRLVSSTELPCVTVGNVQGNASVKKDGWRWHKSWRVQSPPSSRSSKPVPKRFILSPQDLSSVSVHLLRNAFGGADRDLRGALLTMDPGRAAKFRDDVSVQVVFFE